MLLFQTPTAMVTNILCPSPTELNGGVLLKGQTKLFLLHLGNTFVYCLLLALRFLRWYLVCVCLFFRANRKEPNKDERWFEKKRDEVIKFGGRIVWLYRLV